MKSQLGTKEVKMPVEFSDDGWGGSDSEEDERRQMENLSIEPMVPADPPTVEPRQAGGFGSRNNKPSFFQAIVHKSKEFKPASTRSSASSTSQRSFNTGGYESQDNATEDEGSASCAQPVKHNFGTGFKRASNEDRSRTSAFHAFKNEVKPQSSKSSLSTVAGRDFKTGNIEKDSKTNEQMAPSPSAQPVRRLPTGGFGFKSRLTKASPSVNDTRPIESSAQNSGVSNIFGAYSSNSVEGALSRFGHNAKRGFQSRAEASGSSSTFADLATDSTSADNEKGCNSLGSESQAVVEPVPEPEPVIAESADPVEREREPEPERRFLNPPQIGFGGFASQSLVPETVERPRNANRASMRHREREGGDHRPGQCFNCNQYGHRSTDCSQPKRQPETVNKKAAQNFVPEEAEPQELFSQSVRRGELFDRFYESDVVVTRGHAAGAPPVRFQPICSFVELNLTRKLRENLHDAHYGQPTPVQQYAIPLIQKGYDVMTCAQTGSGKTAAFLLPIMADLVAAGNLSHAGEDICSPRCVIIAPTRELAVQIFNEARKFAFETIVRVRCVYGGTAVAHQKESLDKGATVLVATMGRLKHFVDESIVSLSEVRYFVIDEADRMLSDAFNDDIKELCTTMTPKEQRQTVLFSATFPQGVQILAQEVLREDYVFVMVDEVGAANKCITQDIILLEPYERKDTVLKLLDIDISNYSTERDADVYKKKTLIFVAQKKFADTLGAIISQSGIPCTTIHSDREQRERHEAMRTFTSGRHAVLVATAVAERGLDIKGVDHVINYDLPDTIDEYVHRIGRTGRVGHPGRATSFYISERNSQLAGPLVNILAQAEQVVPEWLAKEASGSFGARTQVKEEEDEEESW